MFQSEPAGEAGDSVGTAAAGLSRGQVGLLVDWLELLEPEIISSCPDTQLQVSTDYRQTDKTADGQPLACHSIPARLGSGRDCSSHQAHDSGHPQGV